MWNLKDDHGSVVIKFDKKEDALKKGVLRNILGSDGGSVRIRKNSGELQEERTFPRAKDAARSPFSYTC